MFGREGYGSKIKKILKGKVVFGEPLSRRTTFRIGGPAEIWFEPKDADDLIRARELALDKDLPFRVIGAGSNLLISTAGLKGLTARLSSGNFRRSEVKGRSIKAGAGMPLGNILSISRKHGLTGIEELAGIPASLGGALGMNAGGILDTGVVKEITVLTQDGSIKKFRLNDINYGYRTSNLSDFIVLGAELELKESKRHLVEGLIFKRIKQKHDTQEMAQPSAGCVFKNPLSLKNSAGKLIEAAGLKGRSVGDAQVSRKHANFIVNTGKATSGDVMELIELIRDKVKRDFDVNLDLEIKVLS